MDANEIELLCMQDHHVLVGRVIALRKEVDLLNEQIQTLENKRKNMRKTLDHIKVAAYDINARHIHDMALDSIKQDLEEMY